MIHKAGSYDQLSIEPFEPSDPGPKEIQVKVIATGINYADVCVRWGIYASAKEYVGWPICPGFEFSGIIIKKGEAVSKFEIGDAVFGVNRFFSYASHVTIPEDQVFKKPESMTHEQAAGFPAVFLTAYHALFQLVVIQPKSTILIHSAAGGVGSALVQLSKSMGFGVVGIVGNPKKKDYVLSLCADHVISKKEEKWKLKANQLVDKGFDIVLDANGVETLQDSFDILAPMGKLICYGFHTMLPKDKGRLNWFKLALNYLKTPKFNPLNMTTQNKSLVTFNLSFLFEHNNLLQEAMKTLLELLETRKIKAPFVQTFPFEKVADAHRALESGNTIGKLVLLFD